jgi:hypothetical protein
MVSRKDSVAATLRDRSNGQFPIKKVDFPCILAGFVYNTQRTMDGSKLVAESVNQRIKMWEIRNKS